MAANDNKGKGSAKIESFFEEMVRMGAIPPENVEKMRAIDPDKVIKDAAMAGITGILNTIEDSLPKPITQELAAAFKMIAIETLLYAAIASDDHVFFGGRKDLVKGLGAVDMVKRNVLDNLVQQGWN